jgi:hypothetical protein
VRSAIRLTATVSHTGEGNTSGYRILDLSFSCPALSANDLRPGLTAQAELLRHLRTGRAITGSDKRVVLGQSPFLPILLRRHVVCGTEMALQRAGVHPVFEADDVLGLDGLLDRHSGLLFLCRAVCQRRFRLCNIAAFDLFGGLFYGARDRRKDGANLIDTDCITAQIAGGNVTDEGKLVGLGHLLHIPIVAHSGVDKECLADLQCQNLSGISIRVRAGTDHVAHFGTTVGTVGIVLCLTNRHVKIGHE